MSTVSIAIGARENNDANIQKIITFSMTTDITDFEFGNMWEMLCLGLDYFVSEIFNDGVGKEFLAHAGNVCFSGFLFHILQIDF